MRKLHSSPPQHRTCDTEGQTPLGHCCPARGQQDHQPHPSQSHGCCRETRQRCSRPPATSCPIPAGTSQLGFALGQCWRAFLPPPKKIRGWWLLSLEELPINKYTYFSFFKWSSVSSSVACTGRLLPKERPKSPTNSDRKSRQDCWGLNPKTTAKLTSAVLRQNTFISQAKKNSVANLGKLIKVKALL